MRLGLTSTANQLKQHYRTVIVGGLLAWVAGNAMALSGLGLWGNHTPVAHTVLWGIVIITAILVLLRCKTGKRVKAALIVLTLTIGLAHGQWRVNYFPANHLVHAVEEFGNTTPITATITNAQPHPRDPQATRATLAIQQLGDTPVTGQAKLWKTTTPLPPAGQAFTATVTLRAPHHPAYPGAFNEARILRADNIVAVTSRIKHIQPIANPSPGKFGAIQQYVSNTFSQLQTRLIAVFYTHLPKAQGDMLAGVVLGSRAAPIDDDVRTNFARTGLIHFLAASGLNVGIVAGAVLWLGNIFGWRERWVIPLAMGAVVLYGILAGWAPSVVRAGSMLLLALSFRWWRQSLSPLMLFCLALALLVAWQPTLLDNLGFQLSLVTTFGILTMVPPLQHHLGRYLTPWGAALVLVPIVAQAWVIPVIGSVFHQVAWHSVALNVVAVACVTPLTLIGFTVAFLGWVPGIGWLTLLALPFASGLLWLATAGNALGQQWPQLVWHPPTLPAWWVAGYYIILLLAAWWLHQPEKNPYAWFSRPRQRIALWVGLLTVWLLAYAGWWHTHTNGADVWVMGDSNRIGGQWAVLARQPNTAQYVGWVPGRVNAWKQRQLTQLAQTHGGGTGNNIRIISVKETPQTDAGPYRMQSPLAEPTLTANTACLFKATKAYNHTEGCAVVWWSRQNRPGKLWHSQHENILKLHPNWVHIRW